MEISKSPPVNLSSELSHVIKRQNVLTVRSRMKVLNALDEQNKKSAEERHLRLRAQAIREILTTEVTYLRQLEILTEFFIGPMLQKKMFSHASFAALSENVKTLYNVSGELINELKKDADNIARAFYKLAPFFKLYSVYAYDYARALDLLEGARCHDDALKDFISKQETRPEVGTKLPALLILPIQRVPRYKLLLKEVLQHTPRGHDEFNLLQACLVEIEKAAGHINTLLAQSEDNRKLLKLQRVITNKVILVKPGRQLIKEGSLMRVSRKGNAAYRRYFILLNDTLLYCKGHPENSLTVCCALPLNKCKVESVLAGGLFRITCSDESLLLYSEKDDSPLWIESLEKAMKKYTECRQTLRKDSSSRIPLRHNKLREFPSEGIKRRCRKRKRSGQNVQEVHLNSSSVMYIRVDDQEDDSKENRCFPFVKRIKKHKDDKMGQTRIDTQEPICHKDSDGGFNCETCEGCNGARDTSLSLYTSPSDCHNQRSSTSLDIISNFFAYVGTSIKGFFNFR